MALNKAALASLPHQELIGRSAAGGNDWPWTDASRSLAWQELQAFRHEVPKSLDLRAGARIAELHRRLGELAPHSRKNSQDGQCAYWDVPRDSGRRIAFQTHDGLGVIGARLTSISIEESALILDMAARVYSKTLLKLPELALQMHPANQEQAVRWRQTKEVELLLTMAYEFKADHLMAFAVSGTTLLGSISAIHGVGERLVTETIGFDGLHKKPISSLPTNSSLDFHLPEDVIAVLAGVKECEVCEVTRLWRSELVARDIPRARSSALSLYVMLPCLVQSEMPKVRYFEFNTKPDLSRMLRSLGFPVINAAREAKPTEGILNTIYGAYFGRINTAEGHKVIPQFLRVDSAARRGQLLKNALIA